MIFKVLKKNFCYKNINLEKPFEKITMKKDFKKIVSPFDDIKIS